MSVSIKFESNQDYQLEAIESITELFEGNSEIEASLNGVQNAALLGEHGLFQELMFSNRMPCSDKQLIENLERVQNRAITTASGEHRLAIPMEKRESNYSLENPPRDFSIEMETGTGKTYVYLRTAIELNQKYGLKKFVIVVPSVAIREGVMATLRLTKDHFHHTYSGIQYDGYEYSSKNITKLRQFATSSHLEILVINIQAFTKDDNIIKRSTDALQGRAPIDFIQAVNPVVILDEPQKLGSERQKEALAELNPLFTLRYSATHKENHNLTYILSPVDAYQRNLVKQIELYSVEADRNENMPYVMVKKVTFGKTDVTATLVVNKEGSSKKQITVRRNDDLKDLTHLSQYEGYIIEEIGEAGHGAFVEFQNGVRLYEGYESTLDRDLIHRAQLRAAIMAHFESEYRLMLGESAGTIRKMKPLTLFFIDRVLSYSPPGSKLKVWFKEEYEKVRKDSKYKLLDMPPADEVHKGYFASTSKGVTKDTRGTTADDNEAYELIMKDKERLLSPEEPVRFIFSHSALAEGWDNPNVFVICNLQESDVKNEVKRRQQLGRGLRLPVMVDGERCRDRKYNRLIVIANESFESFAESLQREIRDDMGVVIPSDYVQKHGTRRQLKLRKEKIESEAFKELWSKIKPRTRFKLDFDSEKLIKVAVENLKAKNVIPKPVIKVQGQIVEGFEGDEVTIKAGKRVEYSDRYKQEISFTIPDILKELSERLPVSRATIYEVIKRADRISDLATNPAVFTDYVYDSVRTALASVLMNHDGLQYEQINTGKNAEWDVELFEKFIPEPYESNLVNVDKSIYDAIPYDSKIERAFAEALDERDDVELFVKLPDWFKVDTPVGGYNPDWAIVMKPGPDGERDLYLVRETKGTANMNELFREPEKWKVTFGGKHFDAIRVDYKMVKTADQI